MSEDATDNATNDTANDATSDATSDAGVTSCCVVLATFPDAETAARIARALVEEQLAACVSLLPGVRSIYRWQGAVEESAELLGVIKTTAEGTERLIARLVELHPYDVPEAIALEVAGGHAPYLAWLAGSVLR